jgi:hypothetical protein
MAAGIVVRVPCTGGTQLTPTPIDEVTMTHYLRPYTDAETIDWLNRTHDYHALSARRTSATLR